MSSEFSVRVEGLSKCYQIYDQPRDRLKQFLLPRVQRLTGSSPQQYFREFWAVNDVSFEVKRGETIGIVGRNGSGKSTLLQMICGTLNPTSGSLVTQGRIAALLELGSGFNPEFTGRENVYMNGAVLGLTHNDILDRFAAIASFADIGSFIDQPVKTYSSGMYVRLAFAVIAHVDANILVIDEALAVGDAVFTQKCMRFLRQFKEKGTLIFVSHDMSSVLNLCERAIWLHEGRLRSLSSSKEVAESYLQYTLQTIYGEEAKLNAFDGQERNTEAAQPPEAAVEEPYVLPILDYAARLDVRDNTAAAKGWKTAAGEVQAVRLELATGERSHTFRGGEMVRMRIEAVAHESMERPILGFLVRDRLGQDLFGENTLPFTNLKPRPLRAGASIVAEYEFRLPMLPNGHYSVMASFADGDLHSNIQHHWLHDALIFSVSSSTVRWGLVGVEFKKVELREVT